MENLQEYLPFLIPLAIIQLVLVRLSLNHVLRHKTYRVGNRALWVVLCLGVSIIGPTLYFAIGKGDE